MCRAASPSGCGKLARGRADFFFQSFGRGKDPSRYLPLSAGGALPPVCYGPKEAQVYTLCAALAFHPCFLLCVVGGPLALVSLASGGRCRICVKIGGNVFQIT